MPKIHFARQIALAGLASLLQLTLGCCTHCQDVGPSIIMADVNATTSAAAAKVAPGDNVIVRLPVQSGTGYIWRTAQPPAYAWVAMILDDKLEPPVPNKPGAESWQVFTLRATKPGLQPIQFVYDRPLEPNAVPAKSFTLNLEVVNW